MRRLPQTSKALREQQMERLLAASPAEQRRVINSMPPYEMLAFDADFESWAHENQLPPSGEGWTVWLMMAGRGFGKTRAGAEWICRLAENKPESRIALVGSTYRDARSVMVEGSAACCGYRSAIAAGCSGSRA